MRARAVSAFNAPSVHHAKNNAAEGGDLIAFDLVKILAKPSARASVDWGGNAF